MIRHWAEILDYNTSLNKEQCIKVMKQANRYIAHNGMTDKEAVIQAINDIVREIAKEQIENLKKGGDIKKKLKEKEDLKDFKCLYCDKVLGSKGALTRHIRLVHPKKFKQYLRIKEGK